MSKNITIGVLIVVMLVLVVVLKQSTPPVVEPPKVCKISDTIVTVKDEYKGAWTGTNRIVTYKSGQVEEVTPSDEFYVGKEVCREWL